MEKKNLKEKEGMIYKLNLVTLRALIPSWLDILFVHLFILYFRPGTIQVSHIDYFHFINKCSTGVEFFLPFLHIFPRPPSDLRIRILITLHSLCAGILRDRAESRGLSLESEQQEPYQGLSWCKRRGGIVRILGRDTQHQQAGTSSRTGKP